MDAIKTANVPLWTGMSRYLDGSRLLSTTLERIIRYGSLRLIDTRGVVHRFGDGSGPTAVLRIKDPSFQYLLALYPTFYLGEGYMNGQWEAEDGGLENLLDVLFKNSSRIQAPSWLSALELPSQLMKRIHQLNNSQRAVRQIESHYEFTLPFFDLFLDQDRQYSCAYYTPSMGESIDEAQERKRVHLARKLRLEPGLRVLDIGSGWGGLALHLAKKHGVRVTGITLSKSQLETARKRANESGLSELVNFELIDYRSLKGTYDRIVSVGMFEHVGLNYYGAFFRQVHDLLSDDGIAVIHSIGRLTPPSATNPWIRKHIFPGGYLPALSEVLPHVERQRLDLTDLEILRSHYAKTLQAWAQRFARNRDLAREMYDERFCRMWEFYLCASQASFNHFGLMVFQLQLQRRFGARPSPVPVTRDYLYTAESSEVEAGPAT